MTEELPTDGRRRQIFLSALRSYSDHCEAPALTPDCPYATEIGPDVRGCFEECMDLLAEHAGEPTDAIDLGKGLGAYPLRRPRRGPADTTKPFDAYEVHTVEHGLPLDRQSPTSIMIDLREALAEPPSADYEERRRRIERIAVYVTELDRRGFDGERLARFVGVYAVVQGLLIFHVMPQFLAAAGETVDDVELPTLEPGLAAQWASVLNIDAETIDGLDFARLMPRMHATMLGRNLEQLVAWEAPDALAEIGGFGNDDDPLARWVFDRFTLTYLHHWATTSLEHEFQWVQSDRQAPSDPRQMAMRRIDRADVAVEMARRQVDRPADEIFLGAPTADIYANAAADMCKAGRRDAAAAVFEALRSVNPTDMKAQNNYAFCIAPDQPEEALVALDTAARLGLRSSPMTVGNRMYALARLGRPASALEAAEQLWLELGPREEAQPCLMWRFDDVHGEPEIDLFHDVYGYILEFASKLAADARDVDTAELWRSRAALRSNNG